MAIRLDRDGDARVDQSRPIRITCSNRKRSDAHSATDCCTMQQAGCECFSATTLQNIFETSMKRSVSKIRPLRHAECTFNVAYGGRRWPALVIVGHSVADDLSFATLFFFLRGWQMTVPTTIVRCSRRLAAVCVIAVCVIAVCIRSKFRRRRLATAWLRSKCCPAPATPDLESTHSCI